MLSTTTPWEALDDIEPTDMKVSSAGWLAKETPEYKTVVPHQQCYQVRGGILIPVSAILKVQKLVAE